MKKEDKKFFFTMEDHLKESEEESTPKIEDFPSSTPKIILPDDNYLPREAPKIEEKKDSLSPPPPSALLSPPPSSLSSEEIKLPEKALTSSNEEIPSDLKEPPKESLKEKPDFKKPPKEKIEQKEIDKDTTEEEKTPREKDSSESFQGLVLPPSPPGPGLPPEKPSVSFPPVPIVPSEKKESEFSREIEPPKEKMPSSFSLKKFLKAVGIILGILAILTGAYFVFIRFLSPLIFKIKDPLAILPQEQTLGFAYFNLSEKNPEVKKFNQIFKDKTGKDFFEITSESLQKEFLGEKILDYKTEVASFLGNNLVWANLKNSDSSSVIFLLEVKNQKKARENFKKIEDKIVKKGFTLQEEKYERVNIKTFKKSSSGFNSDFEELYFCQLKNYFLCSSNLESLKEIISVYKSPKKNPSLITEIKRKDNFKELALQNTAFAYVNFEKLPSPESNINKISEILKYKEIFLSFKTGENELKIKTEVINQEKRELIENFSPQFTSIFPSSTFIYHEGKNLKKEIEEHSELKKILTEATFDYPGLIDDVSSLLDKNVGIAMVVDFEKILFLLYDFYLFDPFLNLKPYELFYFAIIADVNGKEKSEVVSKLINIQKNIKKYLKKETGADLKFKPISFEKKTFYSLIIYPQLFPEFEGFNFAYFNDKVFFTTTAKGMKDLISVSLGKTSTLAENSFVNSFEGFKYPAGGYFEINFEPLSKLSEIAKEEDSSWLKFLTNIQHIKAVSWREASKESIQLKIFFK